MCIGLFSITVVILRARNLNEIRAMHKKRKAKCEYDLSCVRNVHRRKWNENVCVWDECNNQCFMFSDELVHICFFCFFSLFLRAFSFFTDLIRLWSGGASNHFYKKRCTFGNRRRWVWNMYAGFLGWMHWISLIWKLRMDFCMILFFLLQSAVKWKPWFSLQFNFFFLLCFSFNSCRMKKKKKTINYARMVKPHLFNLTWLQWNERTITTKTPSDLITPLQFRLATKQKQQQQ